MLARSDSSVFSFVVFVVVAVVVAVVVDVVVALPDGIVL